MVKEYALIVNTADCVGCSACEVACKQAHNLPVGPRWIRVYPGAPFFADGKWQIRYSVTHCMHCSRPSCMDACPVKAITKRRDGVVLVDKELCIGCKDCIDACPLGVMQFEEEKNVAQKCNLCVESIDMGLKPACVNACPSHCIYFGDIFQITQRIGQQRLLTWYKGVSK